MIFERDFAMCILKISDTSASKDLKSILHYAVKRYTSVAVRNNLESIC